MPCASYALDTGTRTSRGPMSELVLGSDYLRPAGAKVISYRVEGLIMHRTIYIGVQ
jgi:hypothetical protein